MDSSSILDGPILGFADTMDGIPGPPVTSFEELAEPYRSSGPTRSVRPGKIMTAVALRTSAIEIHAGDVFSDARLVLC